MTSGSRIAATRSRETRELIQGSPGEYHAFGGTQPAEALTGRRTGARDRAEAFVPLLRDDAALLLHV